MTPHLYKAIAAYRRGDVAATAEALNALQPPPTPCGLAMGLAAVVLAATTEAERFQPASTTDPELYDAALAVTAMLDLLRAGEFVMAHDVIHDAPQAVTYQVINALLDLAARTLNRQTAHWN